MRLIRDDYIDVEVGVYALIYDTHVTHNLSHCLLKPQLSTHVNSL